MKYMDRWTNSYIGRMRTGRVTQKKRENERERERERERKRERER